MDVMPPDLTSLSALGKPIPVIAQMAPSGVVLPRAGSLPAQQVSQQVPIIAGVSEHPKTLALPQWQTFPAGLSNAITDVPGVLVGQVTFRQNNSGPVRTGVTAVVPDAVSLTRGLGNLATTGFKAAVVCLSGNGELTGSSFINEFGVLNGPVLLTNTRSVGMVLEGVERFFEKHFPAQWSSQLPVVGECWDGFFNSIEQFVIPPEAAEIAIQQAKSGPVLQGRAGAGTGMRSFELHAGIGSASRKLTIGERDYTVGVLVNTNHSRLKSMNPVIRQQLESRFGPLDALKARDDRDAVRQPASSLTQPRQGSIQVVIATDIPLNTNELRAMGLRAGLALGLTGSAMATTSGDFVTVFTTANPVPMGKDVPPVLSTAELHPDEMTPVFRAVIEAVLEAQLNALVASHT